MAITKTHPIKSTLKAALDYILNPEKTDGKLLASSFGCGMETADIELAWTREMAGDRGTHLGRHLIQSFAVLTKAICITTSFLTPSVSLTTKNITQTSRVITKSGAPATGYVKSMGYPL